MYFIQTIPGQRHAPVWRHSGSRVMRIDVSNSDLSTHELPAGVAPLELLRSRIPGSTFDSLSLAPGEYYSRMARASSEDVTGPLGRNPDISDSVLRTRVIGTGQLHSLNTQLEQICRVVHPEGTNLNTFGHEIRNLLLVACTEVEGQCKGILNENGITKERMTTNDYVVLASPMKLRDYEVAFPYYPWVRPIKPFEQWGLTGTPTRELQWYSAYNEVKHDRESKFHQATLMRAFEAVAGCFVMLCAQYGWDFALKDDAAERAFLRLVKAPQWTPHEVYVPPFESADLKKINYPFR